MLIITEKPSVAKDFAKALACSFSASDQAYKSRDGEITIVHCVGHLFILIFTKLTSVFSFFAFLH